MFLLIDDFLVLTLIIRVGYHELVGEIIRLEGDMATIQVISQFFRIRDLTIIYFEIESDIKCG